MVALSALVSGLDAELVRLGYKDSTMAWYRGSWRRLRYFAARDAEEFSLDLAMAWVDEACGFLLCGAPWPRAFGQAAVGSVWARICRSQPNCRRQRPGLPVAAPGSP